MSPDNNGAIIELAGVSKWFDAFQALKQVDMAVRLGERVVVCGPSGSGKSTMIRCINRLESHDEGRIVVDGIELNDDTKNITAIRREVGMVFQQFNLFPHLTVLQNLTLAPIRARKLSRQEADALGMEYLERVRIPEQAQKYPGQLSGGQQQRVAIARSLVHAPQDHAVRRADLGARSGDDQGGARRHDRARRGGHDHGLRHPRDGLRQDAWPTRWCSWITARSSRRRRRRRSSRRPATSARAPS